MNSHDGGRLEAILAEIIAADYLREIAAQDQAVAPPCANHPALQPDSQAA